MPQEVNTADQEVETVETPAPEALEQITEPESEAAEPVASVEIDVEARVQEALMQERNRIAELSTIGDKFGFKADADQFVASGKSIEDFRAHILAKSPEAWKASLAIQNPSVQESEGDGDDSKDATEAIAKIKERRQAKFN